MTALKVIKIIQSIADAKGESALNCLDQQTVGQ